jgi:hypothetical protein
VSTINSYAWYFEAIPNKFSYAIFQKIFKILLVAWSSAVQFTPIMDALLHHLFAPCGMEQLVLYPVVIEEGDACVAVDVKFAPEHAASQAFAVWDGRCM